ncbi:MAG: hypothetical protein IKQ91_03565 [Oscillospiraceae bacterium]|nr:hypothetical protein [Oscillospiraceae bacterium]
MALNPQKFAEMNSLRYDRSANMIWGLLNGYSIFLKIVPRRDSVILRLAGKLPETADAVQLSQETLSWSAGHTGISGLIYQQQQRCLTAAVSLTPRDTEQNLSICVNAVVSFAAEHQLRPCCMFCGTEYGFTEYILDGEGITACDACKPQLQMKIQDIREESAEVQPNILGMIAGAVIGAVLVFVLTYFVLNLSYLSFLTGYAGLLVGLLLMRKFGRKLTVSGVLICSVLCIISGSIACVLHMADVIVDYNYENESIATEICVNYLDLKDELDKISAEELEDIKAYYEEIGEPLDLDGMEERYQQALLIRKYDTKEECLRDLKELLGNELYSDLKPELIKCLAFVILSIVAGAAATAPRLLRDSMGIHTMRELGA